MQQCEWSRGSPQSQFVPRPCRRGSPSPLSRFTIMSVNRVTCDIRLVTTGRFSIHTGQTIRSISQTPNGRSFGRLAVLQALNSPPAFPVTMHVVTGCLIDLSWNSKRLRGNTYSLLDTARRDRARRAGGRERPARSADAGQPSRTLSSFTAMPPWTSASTDIPFSIFDAALADNLLRGPWGGGSSPAHRRRDRRLGDASTGGAFSSSKSVSIGFSPRLRTSKIRSS